MPTEDSQGRAKTFESSLHEMSQIKKMYGNMYIIYSILNVKKMKYKPKVKIRILHVAAYHIQFNWLTLLIKQCTDMEALPRSLQLT